MGQNPRSQKAAAAGGAGEGKGLRARAGGGAGRGGRRGGGGARPRRAGARCRRELGAGSLRLGKPCVVKTADWPEKCTFPDGRGRRAEEVRPQLT